MKSPSPEDIKDQQDNCLNCGEKFIDPSFTFCPKCGQHSQDRLTLGLLFRNTVSSYFSLDSRLLKSFFPLLFMPGKVALEFVQGKRLKHLHPSQAYVMYSIVFFFIFSFFSSSWQLPELTSDGITFANDDDQPINVTDDQAVIDTLEMLGVKLDSTKQVIKEVAGLNKFDSLVDLGRTNNQIMTAYNYPTGGVPGYFGSKAVDVVRDKGSELLPTVISQIPLSIFLLVPIYAIILWLVNIRRKKTYAENLVLALYLFSFVFFVLSVMIGLVMVTDNSTWFLTYVIVPPIYFLLSYMRFYKQGFFKSLLKLIIISILFSIIIIPFAFLLTTILTFLFYG